MPWMTGKPMDQKLNLISCWLEKRHNITDLSAKFDVSRKTIYKYIGRYEKEGIQGLKEKCRIPRTNPKRKPERIKQMVLEAKVKHTRWGPKKLVAVLGTRYPEENWPSASTAGGWLKEAGLVNLRKRKNRVPRYSEPFIDCLNPNDVWSIDYKGQYHTRDKNICYPLTVTDNYSRYLLCCDALKGPRLEDTYNCLKKAFHDYGLPYAIRSDNGVPFATASITGLTKLSIWWIKLGIRPERIEAGEPQQNGRHERMHRTLKEFIVDHKAANLVDQQNKFNEFKNEYNFVRPHEALDQKTPATAFVASFRNYPAKLPGIEYECNEKIRIVRTNGEIRLNGKKYFLSELLCGEPVELRQINDTQVKIYYSFYPIGMLDLKKQKIFRIIKVLPMSPV